MLGRKLRSPTAGLDTLSIETPFEEGLCKVIEMLDGAFWYSAVSTELERLIAAIPKDAD